ncbi:hypothetical protein B0H12DRAFT_1108906 [Mycena haematopus]|nr:hypothetical protein B0H12DRAFT_1108906 [Mycena haematopus]
MEVEVDQYDGFTKKSTEPVPLEARGLNRFDQEEPLVTFQVYLYSGNPMPGENFDNREFVCLGKDGNYKFMLLGDLEKRILWTKPEGSTKFVAPACYQKDREGDSGLQLWELEGDLWKFPTKGALWEEWFNRKRGGNSSDSAQWNIWKAKASTAQNSNSLLGFPKFARFWTPETRARFIFEPANTDLGLKKALDAAITDLEDKWVSCPKCDVIAHGKKDNDLVLWATHYFGFYNIWVSHADHQALIKERDDGSPWPAPDEKQALLMDEKTWGDHLTSTVFQAHELQQSSCITKARMEKAMGKRNFVDSQADVMGVKSSVMYETLCHQTADRLTNGLWPAEWLHRSAFSFNGLGLIDEYKSSQVRKNLVLGTSESNTYMILLESAISEYVTRTNKSGTLITTINYKYGQGPDSPVWNGNLNGNGDRYTWLAPTLVYNFRPDEPIRFDTNPPTPPIPVFTANVETFSRRLTSSLEARASYYFLANMYSPED